jgi:hypothetical protein
LLAASSIRTLHICELATGKEVWQTDLKAHGDCISFSLTGRLAALGGQDTVQLFEVASGNELECFKAEGSDAKCLAFAPDGRSLASGYSDTTIRIWDVAGARRAPRREKGSWRLAEQEAAWADLASADARRAYRAVWRLQEAPSDVIALIGSRLRAVTVSTEQVETWIADLDSNNFAVRNKAERALEACGDQAAIALRRAAKGRLSLEAGRRVARLLEAINSPTRLLRELRALEVLENTRTPEASRLLDELAKGPPSARVAQQAKAAVHRLRNRP